MTSRAENTSTPVFPPPETPTESFPYRIEEQIGLGSMGVVYRAVDTTLDRTVAIKTLRHAVLAEESLETRTEMRNRFLQEARAAARLSHPGIMVVHRVDEEGGVPYMVTEWLEGRTLEEILAERGKLPIEEAAGYTVALLDILDAAHREGVVHRDIKPANLILLEDGRLKVTDFGIALVKGSELVQTQAGVVLATPRFASPEQLRGAEVDAGSDLFSTGVLLYHMLTGKFPFKGKTFLDLANAILQREPIPLHEFIADVPPALEAVLRRAFQKNARERYPTAADMAEPLRPFAVSSSFEVKIGTGSSAAVARVEPGGIEDTNALPQVYRQLPAEPARALVEVIGSWPARELERQSAASLLDRLLEKPLHAPSFAGAAVIGTVCLFVEDGTLWGAVDVESGESGDAVAERLPRKAGARLHALPAIYPEGFVTLLTTVLRPPRRRQSDLDSTFIQLPALARKLSEEKFDGLLRFTRGEATAWFYFSGGELVVNLFSDGWDGVPIERDWTQWVAHHPVMAHVEEKSAAPVASWYRHALRDLEFTVQLLDEEGTPESGTGQTTSSRMRELFRSPRGDASRGLRLGLHLAERGAGDVSYEQAPAYRFLTWMLRDLPGHFDKDLASHWRYLAEWLGVVRKVRLYHDLHRPGSRESDFFDLVTTDESGRVLHVGERLARPTEKSFKDFLDRVLQAKHSRVKTGDIGGAFLVAPEFDDDTLAAYEETIQGSMSGSLLGLGESLTGYRGFVRIGARRGFHLMLVEETRTGDYEPLLPR